MWLDSREVENIALLAPAAAGSFAGHVIHVNHFEFVVRDANFSTRTFTYDGSTVFFNSVTGLPVQAGELFPGMRVQVVADAMNNSRVATITVLTN
jgi:hypothetical protein